MAHPGRRYEAEQPRFRSIGILVRHFQDRRRCAEKFVIFGDAPLRNGHSFFPIDAAARHVLKSSHVSPHWNRAHRAHSSSHAAPTSAFPAMRHRFFNPPPRPAPGKLLCSRIHGPIRLRIHPELVCRRHRFFPLRLGDFLLFHPPIPRSGS